MIPPQNGPRQMVFAWVPLTTPLDDQRRPRTCDILDQCPLRRKRRPGRLTPSGVRCPPGVFRFRRGERERTQSDHGREPF